MGTEGGLLAAETAGCDLERSAGRPGCPEVHQPGNSARENLAVSSRARASEAAEREGAESDSVSGRLESSPGLCSARPAARSDGAGTPGTDRVAAAQRARISLGEPTQTRAKGALVRTGRRTRLPAQ